MITFEQQPLTPELKKLINDGFSRYAMATVGHDEKNEPVAFLAMEGESVAGAVVVEIFWGALHVKNLFVEEGFRGHGLATQLMEQALAFGLENRCSFAFLETMSFQALGFYQKLGFELDFTREGFAHGTAMHYLKKVLLETV